MKTFANSKLELERSGQGLPPGATPAEKAAIADLWRERAKRRPSPVSVPNPARGAAVRIYRPARSVMQAGRRCSKSWVLEFEPRWPPEIEPLMGWTSSRDTLQQVRLTFPNKERAVAFAERQGWSYTVIQPHEPKVRPKNYADNFRWRYPLATPAAEKVQAGRR